jgi:hypothetical protein
MSSRYDPDERRRQVKLVESLAKRGIAPAATPRAAGALKFQARWMQIGTSRVAEWAAESARKVMLALVESLATVGDIADAVGDVARKSARQARVGRDLGCH